MVTAILFEFQCDRCGKKETNPTNATMPAGWIKNKIPEYSTMHFNICREEHYCSACRDKGAGTMTISEL